MKPILALLIVLSCTTLTTAPAQSTARAYSVTERGPHHQVLEAPDARPGAPPHRIVEIATGMHYLDETDQTGTAWKRTEAVFEATDTGFIATRQQHRVQLANDLNVKGATTLRTPGGADIQATPIAVALYDTASRNFQVIGVITNCTGVLIASNQVLYANAFAGVCADLVVTISQYSYESDAVFSAKLDPADYGFPRETTKIQVLTEFYQSEPPAITRNVVAPDTIDETLTFGDDLVIGSGLAYTTPSLAETNRTAAVVTKQYLTVDQRQILVESVDFRSLADALLSLPECDKGQGAILKLDRTKGYAALPRLPAKSQAKTRPLIASKPIAMASSRKKPGVTIDFRATLNGGGTLQADTTYLVSGTVNGGITIEGGTVLKYKTNSCILTSGSVLCKTTGSYRPAIFTCVDDDTVGETMQGYSGSGWTGSINPNGYASPAIALGSSSVSLNNCVFRYAASALQCGTSSSGYTATFSHLQFLKCGKAIELYPGNGMYNTLTINLNNALLSQVQYPFYMPSFPYGLAVNLAHGTIDQANRLFLENGSFTLRATNSIFANITNTSTGTFVGAYNGFWSSAQSFGAAPLTVYSSPFLSVGAGNYYLNDTSGFRNYGTTSGPPATLLSDLKKRTTYPPIIAAGTTWNTSQTLTPQAQRDTDPPDLGWHPAALDYCLGWVFATNCTVSILNSAAIGTFATNIAGGGTYGLAIGQGATLQSVGTPNNPNWFIQYNLVQEQPMTTWFQTSGGQLCSEFQGLTPAPVINCRFTQFSIAGQAGPHFNAPANTGPFNFTDCEFHGGKLLSAGPTINLTNCLLERVYTDLEAKDSPTTTYMRNCLVLGGAFTFAPTNSFVQDNFFDKVNITNWNGYTGTNAYYSQASPYRRLQPTRPDDIVLMASPSYQAGPLGNFYLLSSSTLINAGFGGTTANQVGLYHYTVTTNILSGAQIKETNSIVDVIYHYVATDTNGVPIDTDGDGICDALEDTNGDGSATGDPTSWLSSENGTTGVNGLQVFTPWK